MEGGYLENHIWFSILTRETKGPQSGGPGQQLVRQSAMAHALIAPALPHLLPPLS